MTIDPRSDPARTSGAPDVANLGIVRPPFVYLVSIVLGLALHFASPIRLAPHDVGGVLGGALCVVAVALFVFAVRTFRTAGTPIPGNRPTSAVVRAGPYRFSRNSIYLSFSLLQLGIALWVDSLWLLITLVAAVGLMSFVVIPREERYLEARFPSEYLDYKASVRRWL